MRKLIFSLLFILPVIILLPGIDQFAYQPGSQYTDLAISHYPDGLYIQRALMDYGQIPLWSPGILSGYPFAANPLSGLFYLPGWLALPFQLPFGFNLMVILHLIWGGLGMYMLLRAEGLAEGPALLGGLLFESYPKLFAHFGAGHLTLLYAVPWTPWLLYAQLKAAGCLKPAGQIALPRMVPGFVLGTIALADVRWAAYAGLAWVAFCLRPAVLPRVSHEHLWQRIAQVVSGILGNSILAAMVAAPLLLPLLEYSALSTRAAMTIADNLTQSLSAGQLFGLFFPYLRAPAEWAFYPGAVVVVLFFVACLIPAIRKRTIFWIGLTLTAIVFAMGSNLPPVALLSRLPGFDMLRVPPRVLFLAGLGFAAVGAFATDYLFRLGSKMVGTTKGSGLVNLVLFGLWVFVVLIGVGVGFSATSPALQLQFGWGAVLYSLATGIVFLALSGRVRASFLMVVLSVTSLGELAAVNSVGLVFRSFGEVLSEGAGAASYLATREEQGRFRIYSPSYSLPQQVAGLYQLELADGVDPLQLGAYAAYMRAASGVPSRGYSVTLPPFADAEPATDNRGYMPDAARLGLLNVRYVVAEYALPGSQLRLLARFGETRIYENPFSLPRAWTQESEAAPGENLTGKPEVIIEPNRVLVQNAKGPGLLVLSEIAYPGWIVRVDEQPADVEPVAGLLRGVHLEAGNHQVMFEYRPLRVVVGVGLAVLAWLAMIVVAALPGLRRG
jgi:hypothetical protein